MEKNQFGNSQKQEQALFSLGQKERDAKAAEKKSQNPNDLAQARLAGTLQMTKERDVKNDRENYAINLRKQKRDELQKRRRGFTGNQNNEQQMQAFDGNNQISQQLNDVDVSEFTIEQAFNYQKAHNLNIEAFTNGITTRMKFQLKDFSILCQLIYSNDLQHKLFACIGLRKLLSIENTPPIQAVIDANLIPIFIQFLHHELPKLQFEAAWCLTNIASGTSDHVNNLIEKDVLQHFIHLLQSDHQEVVEQVIWGIGNIAGDSPYTRDRVISSGAVETISKVLQKAQPDTSFARNSSWALSNLCRGKPSPNYQQIRLAIPTLIKVLVENTQEEIIIDICWALSYLADGAKDKIDDFLEPQLIRKLIILINHEAPSISIPCLRVIGNITTGDDSQTQYACDNGLIEALGHVLKHPKKTLRKEACWVLSNITAGSQEQLQMCIDQGLIDILVDILTHDDTMVKMEAVWALSNSTAGANPVQFGQLVEKGIIKGLCKCLKIQDVKMLAVALEGLYNILKCGKHHYIDEQGNNRFALIMEMQGSLDDLEELQTHPNHNIYAESLKIIEEFFQEDTTDVLIQTINKAQQEKQNNPYTPGGGLFDL